MAVMDADTGKIVATPPIGNGIDATAFDPGAGLVFNSCGDGTLSVIHEDSPDQYTVVENASTHSGARTMALDPATHHVYLAIADFEPAPEPAPGERPRRKMIAGTFGLLEFAK
jgi:DNA-binding beta-propeller fold protein YncE